MLKLEATRTGKSGFAALTPGTTVSLCNVCTGGNASRAEVENLRSFAYNFGLEFVIIPRRIVNLVKHGELNPLARIPRWTAHLQHQKCLILIRIEQLGIQ